MDRKALRCLVVDDEPLVRKLVVRHLIQQGFQCDSIGDGHEASRLLAERQYDCILVDLQVPGKNGHALCLQALNLEQPPLIAVMTGLSIPQIEVDLRKRGVKNFYYKPSNLKQIGLHFREQFQLHATQSRDSVALESQADTIQTESQQVPAHSTSESSSSQEFIANHDGTSEHFVIVVYCSMNDRTAAIAALLQEEGYPAIAAKSSDHLLETLNSTRVDLLVIERELRGFLNGIQIIESLCDQLLSVTDDTIIDEFYAWDESKQKFTRAAILKQLRWMRSEGYVPSGKGERTQPRDKKTKLPSSKKRRKS